MEGTFEELLEVAKKAQENGADLGLTNGETVEQKVSKFQRLLFDPAYDYTLTEKSPGMHERERERRETRESQ